MNSDTQSKREEGDLKNSLKAVRTRLGLSQNELARRAGVARQTIGGIEAALHAPSAAVALRLARTLGCRLEELFWLEDEPAPTVSATRAQSKARRSASGAEELLLLGQVGSQWVAHPLAGDAAFRAEMMPADGVAMPRQETGSEQVEVQLLDSLEALSRTVLIAGCSPALSLWTRAAQRWYPGLRASWIHANSTQALESLARGEVHIAGLHLCDPQTGQDNVPFVVPMMGDKATVLINFGVWEEGLLLSPGNPQKIRGLADLASREVRFINREEGAGARLLFDTLLQQEKVASHDITGYKSTAHSHQAVAQTISAGNAAAGMGTAAIAQIYKLDFLPLRQVRFDFAVQAEFLAEEPVSQLFETLSHKAVRLQLQKLGGYDTAQTGEIMARI